MCRRTEESSISSPRILRNGKVIKCGLNSITQKKRLERKFRKNCGHTSILNSSTVDNKDVSGKIDDNNNKSVVVSKNVFSDDFFRKMFFTKSPSIILTDIFVHQNYNRIKNNKSLAVSKNVCIDDFYRKMIYTKPPYVILNDIVDSTFFDQNYNRINPNFKDKTSLKSHRKKNLITPAKTGRHNNNNKSMVVSKNVCFDDFYQKMIYAKRPYVILKDIFVDQNYIRINPNSKYRIPLKLERIKNSITSAVTGRDQSIVNESTGVRITRRKQKRLQNQKTRKLEQIFLDKHDFSKLPVVVLEDITDKIKFFSKQLGLKFRYDIPVIHSSNV